MFVCSSPWWGVPLLQYGRIPAVPIGVAATAAEYAVVITGEGPDGGNATRVVRGVVG